jgi:hypothetical protein
VRPWRPVVPGAGAMTAELSVNVAVIAASCCRSR